MLKVNEVLEIAEELYEYSIVHKNEYVKDKAKLLMRNLAVIAEQKYISNDSGIDKYADEIAKVKRKVPKWMKKTQQYNYRILKAYMDISNFNENPVLVDELQKYSNIDAKTFLGHYNGMKTISAKNHGKIFEEIDKKVELWEPVAEFIEGVFEKKQEENTLANVIEIKIGEFVKEHIENIVDFCIKDKNELEYLQTIQYSRDEVGLGVNYSFIGLANNVEHERYWTTQYSIDNKYYRFCSQFGGALVDEIGLTRSEREGQKFKNYLIDKNILLDKYQNKKIKFIVD
jgi:hypothetical protein